MDQYSIKFEPEGLEVKVSADSTIMEALNTLNIYLDFPCGGKGKCGKCKVLVIKGAAEASKKEEELLETEEVEKGVRLACVAKVKQDMVVDLSFNQSLNHSILASAENRMTRLEAHFDKKYVTLSPPTLENPDSDWSRIKKALQEQGFDSNTLQVNSSVLKILPETLRKNNYSLTALIYNNEVVGLEEGNTTDKSFGMAFDIGTTTIVGYLIDLITGKELEVVSTVNPQTKFGGDVISRINFASQEGGLNKLHEAVTEAIDKLVSKASTLAGVDKKDIYIITIAGNTTMHHLFVGISPKYLSQSPYVPVTTDPLFLDPVSLGISINEVGKVLVLPNIAGFVGADTVAVLLATELEKSADIKLMIDIGTNGEIVLGSSEKMFSCSAAAGPAFEGAEITCGMRGAEGAIDHVYFRERLEYSVIGKVKPKGICGSALLDIVAGLVEVGIVNTRGKILAVEKITNPIGQIYKDYVIEIEGELAFLIVEGSLTEHGRAIVVTQSDIRQLQLAKGAMAAGIKILLERYNIEARDVKEVLLAGAFGNYMNPISACIIGLIPRELENKIRMVGNAAGSGSKIALLSKSEFVRAKEIANFVGHVELASYPDFRTIFAKYTYFNK